MRLASLHPCHDSLDSPTPGARSFVRHAAKTSTLHWLVGHFAMSCLYCGEKVQDIQNSCHKVDCQHLSSRSSHSSTSSVCNTLPLFSTHNMASSQTSSLNPADLFSVKGMVALVCTPTRRSLILSIWILVSAICEICVAKMVTSHITILRADELFPLHLRPQSTKPLSHTRRRKP